MPHFDIIRKSDIKETFRVQKLKADFDIKNEHTNEHFVGDIKLPDDWQIGVIWGGVGYRQNNNCHEIVW